jgi:DNA repair protein RadC
MRSAHTVRLVVTELVSMRDRPKSPKGFDGAVTLLTSAIGMKDREHVAVVHLSQHHDPIAVEIVAIGDTAGAIIHPREVFKGAMLNNAAAIVVGHNHPTGVLAPSEDDIAVARRLRMAGIVLAIPVIESLGVCGDRWQTIATTNGPGRPSVA